LWAAYGKHFRGPVLWLIRAWFLLMTLSTLTTWQHHFIDLPTGLWVGLLVLMLVPDPPAMAPSEPNADAQRFKVGAIYFAGGIVCAVLAWRFQGPAWILLWPAGTLPIVAAIYWAGRPELFRKKNGRVPEAVVAVVGPYLAGTWLNARWRTRGKAYSEIADGVWVGRLPRNARRFGSVVDVTAELIATNLASSVPYCSVPMLDVLVPTLTQIETAVKAVDDFRDCRPTLVCCAQGRSRSVTVVAAWLIASRRANSVDEAVHHIYERRPHIYLRGGHRARLEEWAARK
jgi:protein-tyrosine phosphatase